MTKCYVCGEPTWVWHRRGEDFKEGHCETCGSTWFLADCGELDLGVIRDEAAERRNDFQLFFERFEGIADMGCEP